MTLPRKRNIFALFTSISLIGFNFYLWNRYALNLPKTDDASLLIFIKDFNGASSFVNQLNEIFRSYHGHSFVLTKLIALTDVYFFNELNFKHLMLTGNSALLLIWWLITRFFKKSIAPVWYAIPIVTLWFSMAFWEDSFGGIASIQNFWVIAFALLSFWILRRNDGFWWWAIPVTFLGFFTNENSILIIPISFLVLLIQKQYQKSIIWILFSFVNALLYFKVLRNQTLLYDYASPTSIKTFFRAFMLTAGSIVEGLPLGSNVSKLPLWNGWLTIFVSICLITYILRNFFKKYNQLNDHDYFYLGGTLFALLSIGMFCFTNQSKTPEIMLNSHFKPYSALLFSFNIAYLTIFVNHKFRDSLTITFLIGASFLYISNQHYHLFDTIGFRKNQISMAFSQQIDAIEPQYKRPHLFSDEILLHKIDTTGLKIRETTEWKLDNYLQTDLRDGGKYLLLTGKKNYLFPFIFPRKHSLKDLFNYNRYFKKGAEIKLDYSKIEVGSYAVFQVNYKTNLLEINRDSKIVILR